MNYNIKNEIEKQIYKSINDILDQFLDGKTFGTRHAREVLTKADFEQYFDDKKPTLKDAKKLYNKKKNIKLLIKDMRFPGFQLFKKEYKDIDDNEIEEKYHSLIKNIFNKIIKDRIALEKDKKNNKIMEREIITFEKYNKINENNILGDIEFIGKDVTTVVTIGVVEIKYKYGT